MNRKAQDIIELVENRLGVRSLVESENSNAKVRWYIEEAGVTVSVTTYVARSPSDHRAGLNVVGDVRRAFRRLGIDLPKGGTA